MDANFSCNCPSVNRTPNPANLRSPFGLFGDVAAGVEPMIAAPADRAAVDSGRRFDANLATVSASLVPPTERVPATTPVDDEAGAVMGASPPAYYIMCTYIRFRLIYAYHSAKWSHYEGNGGECTFHAPRVPASLVRGFLPHLEHFTKLSILPPSPILQTHENIGNRSHNVNGGLRMMMI